MRELWPGNLTIDLLISFYKRLKPDRTWEQEIFCPLPTEFSLVLHYYQVLSEFFADE